MYKQMIHEEHIVEIQDVLKHTHAQLHFQTLSTVESGDVHAL